MASKALKSTVHDLLVSGNLEDVAELAAGRRRVLGSLISLTYDPDLQVVWRAIEAMGMAVERVAATDKAYVKEHLRRLYWLITEEAGAVFWRAPECMAECCVRLPALSKNHIPIAFHLLETLEEEDLERFRPGAIWAIGRLIGVARDDLPTVLPLVIEALDRPDSQARGMAVWCLGEVGETRALEGRTELKEDRGPVHLYRDRVVEETTVASLTRDVLEKRAP
ncbi:MAG: DVU0298 family protein [Gemmatimonadota bacterium]